MRALNRIINSQIIFFILTLSFVLNYIYKHTKWGKAVLLTTVPLFVLDNYYILSNEVVRYRRSDSIEDVEGINSTI